MNGSIPLFYELTMECTYPIAEGIPMAVLTTSNHVASLLFLAAVMIPGIGKGRGNAGALLKKVALVTLRDLRSYNIARGRANLNPNPKQWTSESGVFYDPRFQCVPTILAWTSRILDSE